MSNTTAAFPRARSFDSRHVARGDGRRLIRGAVISLGAATAAGALVTSVTLTAALFANTAFSTNPRIHAPASMGPRALALAGPYRVATVADAAAPNADFETRWARAMVPASRSAVAMPVLAQRSVAVAVNVPMPAPRPIIPVQVAVQEAVQVAQSPDPVQTGAITPEAANNVPLPKSHPATPDIAPQFTTASLPPAPEKHVPAPKAHDKMAVLPGPDSRIAVYDIAAHTVYMPNGQKLEAHSGLGHKRDDPRYVKVRMRGPTPPNVYDLTLREELFHGVRAIRLNPVDEDKMFGRDGMLAHTYMLGQNGQSNGCVSFKDYNKFLRAFLKGDVDRLVVVARLGNTPIDTARRPRAQRYALNSP